MTIRGKVLDNLKSAQSKLEQSSQEAVQAINVPPLEPKGVSPKFPSSIDRLDSKAIDEAQARGAAAYTTPVEDEIQLLKTQVAAHSTALNAILPAFNALVSVVRRIPGAGSLSVPSLGGLPSITANIPTSSDITGFDDLPSLTPIVSIPSGPATFPQGGGVTVPSPSGPLRENDTYYNIVANAAAARIEAGETQYIQKTDPTQKMVEDVIKLAITNIEAGRQSIDVPTTNSFAFRAIGQVNRILLLSVDKTFKLLKERGFFNRR